VLYYKKIIRRPIWNDVISRENYIQSSIQTLDYEQFDALMLTKDDIKYVKPLLNHYNPIIKIVAKLLIENIDKFERNDRKFIENFVYGFLEELKEIVEKKEIYDKDSF